MSEQAPWEPVDPSKPYGLPVRSTHDADYVFDHGEGGDYELRNTRTGAVVTIAAARLNLSAVTAMDVAEHLIADPESVHDRNLFRAQDVDE